MVPRVGLQAEWNWGRGPEFDPVSRQIVERPLRGGYVEALEPTVTYGWVSRREADERRLGQAEGELLRVQAQWNY